MNDIAKLFYSIEEPFAAGLFEEPERGYFYRYCLAGARYFEHLRPAPYEAGELVYPRGKKYWDEATAMVPHYANSYEVNWELLEQKSTEAAAILREFNSVSTDRGN